MWSAPTMSTVITARAPETHNHLPIRVLAKQIHHKPTPPPPQKRPPWWEMYYIYIRVCSPSLHRVPHHRTVVIWRRLMGWKSVAMRCCFWRCETWLRRCVCRLKASPTQWRLKTSNEGELSHICAYGSLFVFTDVRVSGVSWIYMTHLYSEHHNTRMSNMLCCLFFSHRGWASGYFVWSEPFFADAPSSLSIGEKSFVLCT